MPGDDADSQITLRVETDDTTTSGFPPELIELGEAVAAMHENSECRIESLEVDVGEWPPRFHIEGAILNPDY